MKKRLVNMMIKRIKRKAENHELEDQIMDKVEESERLVENGEHLEALYELESIGDIEGVRSDDLK